MADVLDKKLWSTENLIKFCGLFVMLVAQYYMLKQEIHDNKTFDTAEKQIINYRLNDLEKHCGISQVAILPKEPNIETENK